MLKVLEISIDLTQPGSTPSAVEKAAAKLPKSAQFLGCCVNQYSVFVFYEVPAPPTSPPPNNQPPSNTTPPTP